MKSFKVGSIVLATDQGLGYLAKDFYDHGLIDKVLVKPHSSRQNHYEWYPDAIREEDLFKDIDCLIFFETAFNWKVIQQARERGIKTILMPMYECTTNPLPYKPDLILSPSLLDSEYYPGSIFIPVPVDVPYRKRERAQVFVHNAGNGGLGGRNGTKELVEALRYIKSPIRLIIRSQIPIAPIYDERVKVMVGQFDKKEIWNSGDVFVFPEKFNGLSLPLQEAFASGMAVMCGNRFPMTSWLPNLPLIPVAYYKKEKLAVEFNAAVFDPKEIAKSIDAMYDTDISELSEAGRKYAVNNSWDELMPQYVKIISKLCEK